MTVYFPEGVSAEGNIKVAFVPAIADTAAPKAATEIKATGAVDLSCYITSEFGVSREQSTGEDRRLCSKEVFQSLGRVTNTIPATEYVYDPQADAADPDNKAYDTLKRDVKGYLVIRYGLDASDVDWAVGQKVDVVPVTCGVQTKLGNQGADEFAKLRIQQTFAVSGPLVEDVELAA
jgi:hypothetical protein